MGKDKRLEEIVSFDSSTKQVRDFQDSATFRLLKTSLDKVARDYYHSTNGSEAKELILDEKKSKELADKLWNVAAEHIAVNYLKLNAERIKELKATKDPASGKPQWDSFIREHLGIDRDSIYEAIKTRGIVRPEELDAMLRPIYEAHANTVTTKIVTSKIDSLENGQAVLKYIADLKAANPKTFEGLTVPTTFKGVEEAQRLYASVIQLLPRDYTPKIAETYKKAA